MVNEFPSESMVETICPNCGACTAVTEPELDEDEIPTGNLLVLCDACGCELGSVVDEGRSREAEPGVEGEILTPSPEEHPTTG
jgi:hypothetical protein